MRWQWLETEYVWGTCVKWNPKYLNHWSCLAQVDVKYWVRVLYTCCDVTQSWFKYLRGISDGFTEFITEFITNRVLHPPIILLWSMAYTYLTLGSWERDIGTCNALTVLRGKQKRKIFSFSFSPANRFSFYSLLTKHTCTCTYLCLCCLFRWGKGHTYLGNYSRYQEWNSFLYLSCEASTKFV